MPGGLVRVAEADGQVVSMQRGGRSKDAWVLGDGRWIPSPCCVPGTGPYSCNDRSAPATCPAVPRITFFGWAATPSGRSIARLLRVVIAQVSGAGTASAARLEPVSSGSPCREDRSAARACAAARDLEGALRSGSAACRASLQPARPQSAAMFANAHRLIGDGAEAEPALPMTWSARPRDHVDADALGLRPRRHDARNRLAVDGPARGTGDDDVQHLQVAIDEGRPHELDWLLELADSVTYRSRYLAAPEWLPVLDMVMSRRGQPALARLPDQGARRVHRQARGDAR